MNFVRYLIVRRDSEWWTKLGEALIGPYSSPEIAIEEAVIAAKMFARSGHVAEVSAELSDEDCQTVYRSDWASVDPN